MSAPLPDIVITRCTSCHSRFLPRPGPCPRCGATTIEATRIPPAGQVLASTELQYPPSGWSAPHRIALIAAAEDIRILALVKGELPKGGEVVAIEREPDRFTVRTQGTASGPGARARSGERGEGESPGTG